MTCDYAENVNTDNCIEPTVTPAPTTDGTLTTDEATTDSSYTDTTEDGIDSTTEDITTEDVVDSTTQDAVDSTTEEETSTEVTSTTSATTAGPFVPDCSAPDTYYVPGEYCNEVFCESMVVEFSKNILIFKKIKLLFYFASHV